MKSLATMKYSGIGVDISNLSVYFCGYLLGYLKGSKHIPKPFVKNSDSNFLLFGYYEDNYFIYGYDNHDEYEIEKSKLEEVIAALNTTAKELTYQDPISSSTATA